MGLSETATVMQLLKHADLTLQKAIEIATLEESAKKDQRLLAGAEAEVCAVKSRKTPKQVSKQADFRRPLGSFRPQDKSTKPCGRCGYTSHTGNQCPANGKMCKKCGKLGHFSTMCRSKMVQEIVSEEVWEPHVTNGNVEQGKYFLGEVNESTDSAWMVTLNVEGHDTRFKIDTGADVSVITEVMWKKMGEPKLTRPQARLTSPGGE